MYFINEGVKKGTSRLFGFFGFFGFGETKNSVSCQHSINELPTTRHTFKAKNPFSYIQSLAKLKEWIHSHKTNKKKLNEKLKTVYEKKDQEKSY